MMILHGKNHLVSMGYTTLTLYRALGVQNHRIVKGTDVTSQAKESTLFISDSFRITKCMNTRPFLY